MRWRERKRAVMFQYVVVLGDSCGDSA